ncbi:MULTISPECIES: hypothetical protein [Bacillus]|uniref:hypothetical protein n=1 Tax=Bacillus TaxID=1386 RepID=UPI0002D96A90|nr:MULTISPECIES: hypothetical protein [Bacillus]
MKKIINWLVEPYIIGKREWYHLKEMKYNLKSSKEKARVMQLQYFTILLLAVYSVFLFATIADVILAFFVGWYRLVTLIMTIPLMLITKKMQKNRYMNRRDAFIKGDSNLIKRK